jgi:hypothetical protein
MPCGSKDFLIGYITIKHENVKNDQKLSMEDVSINK